MEVTHRAEPNEAATMKEGRDFFNEEPKPEYYKPFTSIRTRCKTRSEADRGGIGS